MVASSMNDTPNANPEASGDAASAESVAERSPQSSSLAERVLYVGMLLFGLIGGGIAVWIANQWIENPHIRATQFDFQAPLWPAALVFVVVATIAGIALLRTAARRVRDGEDLFAQRHRRRSSDGASEASSAPDKSPS
jgi:H+/Cl- antiporter ClcA